jgi:hypothetical protein
MPYILPGRRNIIDKQVGTLLQRIENELEEGMAPHEITGGDMNYLVSLLVHRWQSERLKSYKNLSEAHAVLSDAAAEFYRTVVAPYEDQKALENGKVSALDIRELNV